MAGFLQQHISYADRLRDRWYSFLLFKFFGTPVSYIGARNLGRLHGKYNWPPVPPHSIDR